MTHAIAVSRGIATYDCDEEIRMCLMALFNWEIQSAGLKNPPYKNAYVKEIEKGASTWQ